MFKKIFQKKKIKSLLVATSMLLSLAGNVQAKPHSMEFYNDVETPEYTNKIQNNGKLMFFTVNGLVSDNRLKSYANEDVLYLIVDESKLSLEKMARFGNADPKSEKYVQICLNQFREKLSEIHIGESFFKFVKVKDRFVLRSALKKVGDNEFEIRTISNFNDNLAREIRIMDMIDTKIENIRKSKDEIMSLTIEMMDLEDLKELLTQIEKEQKLSLIESKKDKKYNNRALNYNWEILLEVYVSEISKIKYQIENSSRKKLADDVSSPDLNQREYRAIDTKLASKLTQLDHLRANISADDNSFLENIIRLNANINKSILIANYNQLEKIYVNYYFGQLYNSNPNINELIKFSKILIWLHDSLNLDKDRLLRLGYFDENNNFKLFLPIGKDKIKKISIRILKIHFESFDDFNILKITVPILKNLVSLNNTTFSKGDLIESIYDLINSLPNSGKGVIADLKSDSLGDLKAYNESLTFTGSSREDIITK